MQQLENDLDQTQEKLMNANQRLEEKEKALQNVSFKNYDQSLIKFFCLLLFMLNHKSTPTKTGYSVVCNLFNKIVKKIQKMGHLDNKKCVWKAKEEVEALEKKMQQLEHELTQTQTNLDTATHNLEEKEKALQNVSEWECVIYNLLHGKD